MPAMTPKALCAIAMFVLATLGMGAAPARAEFDFDIFGGVSLTESTNVAVDGIDNTNVSVKGVFSDVKVDPGFTVGLRLGYWFESLPFLGLGIDGFYFSLPVPAQTVDSSANISGSIRGKPFSTSSSGQVRLPSIDLPSAGFSPQLMLRWPLFTSNEMPKGRLQPYVGFGPAWAVSIDRDELALVIGGLVRGGIAFNLFRHLALFAEYRYSWFPNFELTDSHGLHFQTDVNTHNVVGGISIRF
jgi:opacity protein-like surface antigen